jgi:glutamate-1-semialdehyde 2,1-aminomutase
MLAFHERPTARTPGRDRVKDTRVDPLPDAAHPGNARRPAIDASASSGPTLPLLSQGGSVSRKRDKQPAPRLETAMVLRDERRQQIAQQIVQTLRADFVASHRGSALHHERAARLFPGGVTHDGRYQEPFQLCVARTEVSYKGDVDGQSYVDYVTGHGSLILGHGHPAVREAVAAQLADGTHMGGNHALEIEWAERASALVPGAERVRFTSSGTEAVMLAVRLARAFTGRVTLAQFEGHFHGWSDTVMGGHGEPGLPVALRNAARVIPCGDPGALEDVLADETVAAVILEPSHPSFYALPDPAAYLRYVREQTERTGALLILDEVVSGFRWSPGGAQSAFGTHGDLTALAKILAGGLPGGAVVGRADVMRSLDMRPDERRGMPKLSHPGTFNANPLSAAAGVACLSLVADPAVQERASATAAQIRRGLNGALRAAGVPGCAYGAASLFAVELGGDELPPDADLRGPLRGSASAPANQSDALAQALNLGMLSRGVALFGSWGITSVAHSAEDAQQTVEAFAQTLAQLQAADLLRA